jgi:hypothetical protein
LAPFHFGERFFVCGRALFLCPFLPMLGPASRCSRCLASVWNCVERLVLPRLGAGSSPQVGDARDSQRPEGTYDS